MSGGSGSAGGGSGGGEQAVDVVHAEDTGSRDVKMIASVPVIAACGVGLGVVLMGIFVLEAFVSQLWEGPGQSVVVSTFSIHPNPSPVIGVWVSQISSTDPPTASPSSCSLMIPLVGSTRLANKHEVWQFHEAEVARPALMPADHPDRTVHTHRAPNSGRISNPS